jgi:probable F420-dependent oxidoreductase
MTEEMPKGMERRKENATMVQRAFRFGAGPISVSSRTDWITYARKVENLGYSTLVVSEHPTWGGIGVFAALMAAADATTELRLGTQVLTNDYRNPVLLAQEAATIDLFSEGRLELGVGGGWFHGDYAAIGVPFDSPGVRISRLEEAIPLIKLLFGNQPVSHSGEFYQVQELNLHPKPKQQPHPPIFIGGGGRRVLTLAAREADIVGLDPKGTPAGTKDVATMTAEAVAEKVSWVQAEAGARFDDLEIHIMVFSLRVTKDRQKDAEQLATELSNWPATVMSNTILTPEQILESPHFLVGTVDQMVADLKERRKRFGISNIMVGSGEVDALSPVVAQLAGKYSYL